MSRRSRMFAVLVCVGVASSAWAAEPTGTAVGPYRGTAVRTEKAVGPFRSSAVKTEKAVGPLRGSAVHTDKTVGHDAKSAAQSPVLDLNAGF
jgi:hypothetical protein